VPINLRIHIGIFDDGVIGKRSAGQQVIKWRGAGVSSSNALAVVMTSA
jgi:hypothetical protein